MQYADDTGLVTRNQLEQVRAEIIASLENGEILIPTPVQTVRNIAGGTNHCPNSDVSYSLDAVTVFGTLPATAGDGNQEAYRFYRQLVGADVVVDSAHALKAVGHSMYAANEGASLEIPDWDRVNGWVRMGGEDGADQYDIAIQLLEPVVSASQRWFFLCRLSSLSADFLPADVLMGVGVWEIAGASQGWITGSAFDLNYQIHGIKGTASKNYRVLASTDSGLSILSNVLNVADAPNVLSTDNRVELFYSAGPGFIVFDIMVEEAGVYTHLFSVRNTVDFKYNDDGNRTRGRGRLQGWPPSPGNSPQALAVTRRLTVGAFGAAWVLNEVQIRVPSNYNKSLTDPGGQFLRFYLSAPTAVSRQVGVDYIWFSTTYNEWAPDKLPPFADDSRPIPSVSPTSGQQGTSTGVFEPPGPGTGGPTCISSRLPMLVKERNLPFRFKRAGDVRLSAQIKGEFRVPYDVIEKRIVMVAEYYRIETENGIVYECVATHRICLDVDLRAYIQARFIKAGETRVQSWVRGRGKVMTTVSAVVLIPEPMEIVYWSLSHPAGLSKDGEGHFIAGFSEKLDRGLYASNNKPSFVGDSN